MTRGRAAAVGIALGLGVGLRLAFAIGFVGNHDERSYEIVAEIMRRGGNVYAETTRYNYTPAWALVLHALDGVALAFGLPLHVVVRGSLTAVDVINALLIGRIGRMHGASASSGFIAYMLNPAAILVIGVHGQFETLAALPLFAAILLSDWRVHASGAIQWLFGTVALVVKHILAFQFWMLFWYAFEPKRRVLLVGASGATFLATFLPYLPDGAEGIRRNVFGYSGVPGVYGFGSFLPYPIPEILFVVMMTSLPLWAMRRRLDVARAMELSAVVMLATIFGIGEQYFLIPIVFASAFRGPWYWAFTAAATVFLATSGNNLHVLSVPPLWNVVWVTALGWAISLAFGPIRFPRRARVAYTAR